MNIKIEQNKPASTSGQPVARPIKPHYEVKESGDAYLVKVMMPGVNKKGVTLSVQGEGLTIHGVRCHAVPNSWRPLQRELPWGDYHLQLRLNVEVDEKNISAKVEEGILWLTLPMAEAVKPRTIEIE